MMKQRAPLVLRGREDLARERGRGVERANGENLVERAGKYSGKVALLEACPYCIDFQLPSPPPPTGTSDAI